ncbi:MAG: hypothetical protein HC913_20920 [Microscillaceae bacterium]|nr:hypothetical protein [Microscillaceae bacterium]
MVTTQKRTKRKTELKSVQSAAIADVFTSSAIKGTVLFLILAFNVLVLKNCFMLSVPESTFSGDVQLDATLYGLAISVLMVIVLFHEEQWDNAFCPGAITLYLDAVILVLYTKWFEWLIGGWWSLWLMNGLMVMMPVMGLFIMVVMLKK